jgi:signal transduction histidine kinase/ActR/RegA family two-component response regulator
LWSFLLGKTRPGRVDLLPSPAASPAHWKIGPYSVVKARLQSKFHALAALVLVVGVLATLVGFSASRSSLRHNNDRLLLEEANQAALLLGSVLPPIIGSPPTDLGSLVTPLGITTSAFTAAAAPLAKSESVALLRVAGSHLRVLNSVGPFQRVFGGPQDAGLITIITKHPMNTFAGAGEVGSRRYIALIWSTGVVRPGFAIYAERPVPLPASGLYHLPGKIFDNVDVTMYVGAARPDNLVFTSTTNMALTGQEAVATLSASGAPASALALTAVLTNHPKTATAPGQFLLVMRAKGNLSGGSAAAFPWLLLTVGLSATALVVGLLEMTLRRRDRALLLVEDLEVSNTELDAKNAELDAAFRSQAETEAKLRQAQKLEAVGQLAGGIAHDFNNLMQVIMCFTGFVVETAADNEEIQADLREVQTAAMRAAELTRQLLTFSRQEVTSPTVVDLGALVNDTERLLRGAIGEDVTLQCLTTTGSCPVRADVGELNQILMNLAMNSRDAMPNGGTLFISVRRVEEADKDSMLAPPLARIEVTDDGKGMTKEVAAKVFEPFYTTKEVGRGTGLGLSMVYGIVHRWGGQVDITTAPDMGTTVTIDFPICDDQPASVEPEVITGPVSMDGQTVLLVEDEEGVLRSTIRTLEAAGHRVVGARNALEAMELFTTAPISVLVTDVIMPGGISGKQLADQIRTTHPDLPVVFVSGFDSETIAKRGILPESTVFLKKPFSPLDLFESIRLAIANESGVHALVPSQAGAPTASTPTSP